MASAPPSTPRASAAQAAARRRSVVAVDVGVTDDLLDELKHRMSIRHFEAGDVIVRAGDLGNEMYFIGSGAVNIVVNEAEKKVIQIKSGFFGEVALYMGDSRRMATVLAAVDSAILILSRYVIDDVLSRYPKVQAEFAAESRRRMADARGGTSGTVEAVGSDWMHKLSDLTVGYDPTVQVAIRVKPPASSESMKSIFKVGVNHVEAYEPSWTEKEIKEKKRAFHFDFMYDETATTERISDEMGVHVCDAVFDGFHTCVLAYGQTGTGKTHTMQGLTLLLCEQLFRRIAKLEAATPNVKFEVKVSHLEVYCEVLRDLLARGNPDPPELQIRGSIRTNIYVDNLLRKQTRTYDELAFFFNAGMAFRTMSKTATNEQSSPAHTIFTVYVTRTVTYEDGSAEAISTKMLFADLAGTQREYQARTGLDAIRHENDGTAELAEHERRNINVALQTLGVVIHKLACDAEPPYRQSKLSLLLAQSLGGNAKTYFIATLGQENLKLSLRTLKDAEFAMRINNKAVRARLQGRKRIAADFLTVDDNAPLKFEQVWSLVREANALMENIGKQVVFSLQPHAEVSQRYPFGVRLTNLESTLSALYDPDEFELHLAAEKLWVAKYYHRESGQFARETDFSLEPFAVSPPMHLVDSLRVPLGALAGDGAVDGVFSNRAPESGPRGPSDFGTAVSLRVSVDLAEARRALASSSLGSATSAARGATLGPAGEERRRRMSTDHIAVDLSGKTARRGSISRDKSALAEFVGSVVPLSVTVGELPDFTSEYAHGVHVCYEIEGVSGASEPLLFRTPFAAGDSVAHTAAHEVLVTDSLLSGLSSRSQEPVEAYIEVWGHRDAEYYTPRALRARLRAAEARAEAAAAVVADAERRARVAVRTAEPLEAARDAYPRVLELFHSLKGSGAYLADREQFDM